TPNNFNIRYNNWPTIVNQTYYPNSYAAFAYDSIWAEAMAMNNSIKRLAELNRTLEDFHYGDREMSRILKEEMYNLNFSGISNIVQFDTFGDVHPHVTYLVQHQGKVKRTVATILPKEKRVDFFTTPPNVIRWAGAGPPVDHIKLKQVDTRLPLHVFIIMAALSCLAIILTIVFMIYNNKYRNAR
ncbi:Gamma-aminobutyric acid type B receptor subunit 1, partial [Trichoplax sp. H2]